MARENDDMSHSLQCAMSFIERLREKQWGELIKFLISEIDHQGLPEESDGFSYTS